MVKMWQSPVNQHYLYNCTKSHIIYKLLHLYSFTEVCYVLTSFLNCYLAVVLVARLFLKDYGHNFSPLIILFNIFLFK